MKYKTLFKPALIVVLAFTACSKQEPFEADRLSVSFCAQQFQNDDATRSAYVNGSFQWTATDTVGIYPDKGSQIYFSMAAGAGTDKATFDGGGWGFRSQAVYYSYYPFMADFYLDRHKIPVTFEGQVQDGADNNAHFGQYDYMYTPGATVKDNSLVFSYNHLVCIIEVKATLPAGTYRQITLTAPTPVFVKKGYFDLQSDSPEIISTTSSKELSVAFKEPVTVNGSATISAFLISAPVDLNGVEITVSALDNEKKQYDCKKTPSKPYQASTRYGLTCSSWTEVKPVIHVSDVSLNRSSISLKVGESKSLEVSVIPEDASDKSINWTSADSSIASVNSIGEVVAQKDGTTYISASAVDGNICSSCKVVVKSDGNNENPDIGNEWQW